jgi:hypothetical protein
MVKIGKDGFWGSLGVGPDNADVRTGSRGWLFRKFERGVKHRRPIRSHQLLANTECMTVHFAQREHGMSGYS